MICKRDEVEYLDYSGAVETIFNSVPSVAKLSKAARWVIPIDHNKKACNAFAIKVNQILRLTVDSFLLITNIGGFAVYILFIGENMEKVMSSEFFSIGASATSFSFFIFSKHNSNRIFRQIKPVSYTTAYSGKKHVFQKFSTRSQFL